ncbi:MAG: DJ-1/PfpI family protein [Phenylobacterium sp.]|uniref:DJ-1/PfpI family protein n=1 Tax=Phenylobacterium sp. TaxID=1871053 RepID=UPI00272786DC|nr:DJ-1/PfpI family protein [Phenylobacterium sp.]MDO8900944.1 DJ-1/PfpI family protein [Phenylobacterium sp.]MDP2215034.1 DJ-1/PfpI family protein [Phenylobacterium sp.]
MTQTCRIVFPLYPGVTQLDFTAPHQVFNRMPGAETVVASVGGADIEGDGLVFTRLAELEAVEGCDVLCVPGGFGTTAAMLDEAYMASVRRLGAEARYVTSVCTGSLILAAAGLLKGRRAACHWAWRDLLTLFDVEVDEGRVCRDGHVITGGGVTAGLDFAFVASSEIFGEDAARRVLLGLEYAPAPPFEGGRPELAPPHILEQVQRAMGAAIDDRRAGALEAARRLRAHTS